MSGTRGCILSGSTLIMALLICDGEGESTRGWTATNMNAQKKLFTVCAIGPIRLLALTSYRSLTNQTLIFGFLDLNFQSEFQQYAGSSLAFSVLLCGEYQLIKPRSLEEFIMYYTRIKLFLVGMILRF